MTLGEFFSSFYQESKSRVKNPFAGAFALSWIIYNWKVILRVLFSDLPIETTIGFIGTNASWGSYLIFPFLTAIFGRLILSAFSFVSELATIRIDKERRKRKQEIREDILEKRKTTAKKEFELEQIKSGKRDLTDARETIEQQDQTIASLETKIESDRNNLHLLENESKTIKEKLNSTIARLKEVEDKKLAILSERDEAKKEAGILNLETLDQARQMETLQKNIAGLKSQLDSSNKNSLLPLRNLEHEIDFILSSANVSVVTSFISKVNHNHLRDAAIHDIIDSDENVQTLQDFGIIFKGNSTQSYHLTPKAKVIKLFSLLSDSARPKQK